MVGDCGKNFQNINVFALILLSAFMSSLQAGTYRAPSELIGWKSTEWEYRSSYFTSQSHYDHHGTRFDLRPQESFQKWDQELSAIYGLSRKMDIFLKGQYRSQENEVDDPIYGRHSLSARGLESFTLGAKYALKQHAQRIMAVDFWFLSPTFSQDTYVDASPYRLLDLGDEAKIFHLGTTLTYRSLRAPWVTFHLAYQYVTEGMSQELPYGIELAHVRPRWAVVGGIDGLFSLKTDEYDQLPAGRPKKHIGTTFLYNSLNRSWVKWYGGFILSLFKNGQLSLTYKKTAISFATDRGYDVLVGLKWKVGGVSEEKIKEDQFKSYDLEANVVKVSPRELFVKIDRGFVDQVYKGMVVDIYQFDYLGGNLLVASGIIHEVQTNESVVKIQKKYRELPLKIGHVVRGNLP